MVNGSLKRKGVHPEPGRDVCVNILKLPHHHFGGKRKSFAVGDFRVSPWGSKKTRIRWGTGNLTFQRKR